MELSLAYGRTPAELGQTLTSSELTELIALMEIAPFGNLRGDYQAAKICEVAANIHARGKDDPAYHVEDFLIDFRPKPKTERIDPELRKQQQIQASMLFLAEYNAALAEKEARDKANGQ